MEAERFIYYLVLTLAAWTAAMAWRGLGRHVRAVARAGPMAARALMAGSAILGFLSWVTLVEFLHAHEPFFTGIPAAMIYIGWLAYLTVHVWRLAGCGGGPGAGARA